jgi:hypothetical protein
MILWGALPTPYYLLSVKTIQIWCYRMTNYSYESLLFVATTWRVPSTASRPIRAKPNCYSFVR